MSWRLLEPGENILPGDEWWSMHYHGWRPISWTGGSKLGDLDNPHRRRMAGNNPPFPDPEAKLAEVNAQLDALNQRIEQVLTEQSPVLSGHDELHEWFGLSYSSWLTMPRAFMYSMPDEWQRRMAQLGREWDATWDTGHLGIPYVIRKHDSGRFLVWPEYVLNYSRLQRDLIDRCRR